MVIFLDAEFFRTYVHCMDLKQAAKRAGVPGYAIATQFRVAQSTVSRWLNRETPVPSENVREFAALLGIDPVDVLPPPKAERIQTESAAE